MADFNEPVIITLWGDFNNGGPSIGTESLVVKHNENGVAPGVTFLNDGGGHFIQRFVFTNAAANLPGGEAGSIWAGWQGLQLSAQQLLSIVIGQRENAPAQVEVRDGVLFIRGNLGIGTQAPAGKLHITGNNDISGTVRFEPHPDKGGNQSHVHWGETGDWYLRSAAANGAVIIQDQNPNAFVGIGTAAPTAKLDVQGDLKVSGDIVLAGGADCAEDFDIAEYAEAAAGSVMVMNSSGRLEECGEPYDKKVAGVISGAGSFKPAIILDKQTGHFNRQPIALMGKVFCKADAQYGCIEVGDMLTSSPTPGHAMKATDPGKAFGAVIGKALAPIINGTGLIPILVSLQ